MNKLVKEKAEEWKEEQQDNTDSVKNQNQEQQPHLSLSLKIDSAHIKRYC